MRVRYVGREQLGNCPACVVMTDPPVYEINRDVWATMSPFERRFILQHEIGHYRLQTDSETAADRYALRHTAGTERESLRKSLITLYNMGCIPLSRVEALYEECKKIDKEHQKQLQRKKFIGDKSMKKQILFRNYADGQENMITNSAEGGYINVADNLIGGPVPTFTSAEANAQVDKVGDIIYNLTNRKRAGIRINGTFISLDTVFSFGILVCAVLVCCKLYKRNRLY